MKLSTALTLVGVAALTLTGCATSSAYVDASDTTVAVKNKNRMSDSDWVLISQDAGNAMLTSPLFAEYLEAYAIDAKDALDKRLAQGEQIPARDQLRARKPLLVLSTIRNNTSEHIDTTLMTNRLREVLFNSNKVRFTTYAADAQQDIDMATAQARQLQADPNVDQRTTMKNGKVHAYDLSLAGSIVKQTAQDGRQNEISYTFSLTLTDNSTGEGVWTYTKALKRQNTQGVFGY